MPGLLSLANELICEISDQLDTRRSFRGTCKRINAVVSHRIFSEIIIDIHAGRLDIGISQLEALATTSTGIGGYVRNVKIRHLAPDYNPPSVYYSHYSISNINPVVIVEPDNLKVDWAEEKMRELLPEALSMLTGATTVVWETCNRNPDWASILVSEFLETLPTLDTLHLVESLGRPRLHLHRVANLTKLSVITNPNAPLADIIANSPHLTHLDLRANMYKAADYTETFHELLRKVPRGRLLRLEHLSIDNYYVRFDHETLPHLRHLRSVEFRSIPYISADGRQNHSEHLLSKSDRFGSSSSDLWRAIRREEIPVEIITTQTSDGVVEYLMSATGVKKINLHYADSDVLANKFFTQALPRYSTTLVSLSILADFEGLWCFGQHNIDILLECTRLAELTIPVDSSNAKQVTMDGIVIRIMGMAAQMPNLWRLELLPACREELRGVRRGDLFVPDHQSIITDALFLIGSKFWFQPVDSTAFRPQRRADGVVKYAQH